MPKLRYGMILQLLDMVDDIIISLHTLKQFFKKHETVEKEASRRGFFFHFVKDSEISFIVS